PRVYHSADSNKSEIVIVFDTEDTKKAKDFAVSADLKEVMKQSGGLDTPTIRLEAENLFLRHQLTIAMRRAPPRLRLRGSDRALLIWMTRLWPEPARHGPGGSAGDYPAVAS